MSDEKHGSTPAAETRKLSPWLLLGVAFVGVLAGRGISAIAGAVDPWNVVITAATVAVAVLLTWAILDRRR
jgi:hypothetical protein